jgi:pyruvate formate-lyase activating enzyme-like uncharacterized protein
MKPFVYDPAGWKQKNRRQYGERYGLLNWVSPITSHEAEKQKANLLSRLDHRIRYGFKDTKIDCRYLSKGCTLCGQGLWSCLFINGLCNCACFYCPNTQDDMSVPTTNRLTFTDPVQYARYIRHFGFQGVSISGGEPFLTFEKCLRYIAAVKQHAGAHIYTWLYTNGTLVTQDKLKQLRDAGLDEIRFDIGAVNYDLSRARLAGGIIPVVTVEIPAVPEDMPILQKTLHTMADTGIRHLNLHQLRLTPYNLEKLRERPYTFLHGEQATVLESELCALEIMAYGLEQELPIGINYCSFHYKNSFQRSAARKRAAGFLKQPHEDITEKGFIRRFNVRTGPDSLSRFQNRLALQNIPNGQYLFNTNTATMMISLEAITQLWDIFKENRDLITVDYDEGFLSERLSYHLPFHEITFPDKPLYAERARVTDGISLTLKELQALHAALLKPPGVSAVPEKLQDYENILPGWKPYC